MSKKKLRTKVVVTCYQPEAEVHCSWCGCFFRCGDAPHDEEGALCPSCGRGEDLEAVQGENGFAV